MGLRQVFLIYSVFINISLFSMRNLRTPPYFSVTPISHVYHLLIQLLEIRVLSQVGVHWRLVEINQTSCK